MPSQSRLMEETGGGWNPPPEGAALVDRTRLAVLAAITTELRERLDWLGTTAGLDLADAGRPVYADVLTIGARCWKRGWRRGLPGQGRRSDRLRRREPRHV